MRVTKRYSYTIRFQPGCARLSEVIDRGSLDLVIVRAMHTSHWISVSAYEDPLNDIDRGVAQKRLNSVCDKLIAESIDEARIKRYLPGDVGNLGNGGITSCRADIVLFPKVRALCDLGEPFLCYEEVSALHTAREVVLFPRSEFTKHKRETLSRYTSDDWMRIIGCPSLEEWARRGAKHPLYDSGPALKCDKPWWKLW